ncbi:lysozyme [Azospirillum picis]|uniref:Lysozyme n=1 Tax=Azospirillum picis TaxID=488438 RepID=A0ABU0MQ01_9PROT|nr:lysozyme [Azospirillum picis]MBP2301582.1 lysozyme [Azospirillum picis]MDQ0535414.1 lysozyme [Azospirillum picis]
MTRPVPPAALDLVKHFEGLFLGAYLCPAGVPTIGWGHTKGVKLGQRITRQQAEELLSADMAEAADAVDRLVSVPLTDNQRGALASFVFNLGPGSLGGSTLLRLLNAGASMESIGEQFGRWVNATVGGVKKQLPGLVARRAAEKALFLGRNG